MYMYVYFAMSNHALTRHITGKTGENILTMRWRKYTERRTKTPFSLDIAQRSNDRWLLWLHRRQVMHAIVPDANAIVLRVLRRYIAHRRSALPFLSLDRRPSAVLVRHLEHEIELRLCITLQVLKRVGGDKWGNRVCRSFGGVLWLHARVTTEVLHKSSVVVTLMGQSTVRYLSRCRWFY